MLKENDGRPVNVKCLKEEKKAAAHEAAFSQAPVFLRSGGTIPVVSIFAEWLQVPPLLMEFALATNDMHGSNEKFYLPNFFRSIQTSLQFMKNVALITQNTGAYAVPHY